MTLGIDVASASRPILGETECGDQAVIIRSDGCLVCALADGLGHGREAARAADAACRFVAAHPMLGLSDLLGRCDQALRETRGAALVVLRIALATGDLVHAGVGNVEVVSLAREGVRPINVPGVVGAGLRKVVESRHRLHSGDLLLAHTDGVSGRLDLARYRHRPAQQIAAAVIEEWGKPSDDAACIVVSCNTKGDGA